MRRSVSNLDGPFRALCFFFTGDDNTVGDSKSIAPAVRHVISLVSARAGQREGWDSKCRYLRLLLFFVRFDFEKVLSDFKLLPF